MILYSILTSVNPSRVENIAKILSTQNVKQRNYGSESVGLGLVLGMTPGKHETGMHMSSSAAKLICSILSHCTDKLQTLRSKAANKHIHTNKRA